MNRFRFTLLAVCLVLLYLGYEDLHLFFNNRQPREVPIEALLAQGPPQDWMTITGGTLKLDDAISTSGTVELDALLVPLVADPEIESFDVLVETRDPQLIDTFRTYHFTFDTLEQQKSFREENSERFLIRKPVRGMTQGSLIASSNEDRLRQLAQTGGLQVPRDVIFFSEGKEPPRYRGFIFTALALLGMVKVLSTFRGKNPPSPLAAN